jgi:hypothetical protein
MGLSCLEQKEIHGFALTLEHYFCKTFHSLLLQYDNFQLAFMKGMFNCQ